MSKLLKIGFLGGSLSRCGGGLVEVQLALAKHLAEGGHDVSVFGISDEYFEADLPRWFPLRPLAASCSNLFNVGFSRELRRNVMSSECEVVHLHTLWKYSSAIVTSWSKRKCAPYIVTPHGMLEPWARKNSGLKKAVASYLYESKMLRQTACIHVFTEKERDDVRAMGLKNPIAIIPNGIDLSACSGTRFSRDRSSPRIMLYLGRLHPKKGLPMLLRSWKKQLAKRSSGREHRWCLAIAGWDQNSHESELKAICTEIGLSIAEEPAEKFVTSHSRRESFPDVVFLGPAFGELKSKLYSHADAFVLPSLSEGLPMTVLEAWAHKLPVLMTHECNLPEGVSSQAAIICDASEDAIGIALRNFTSLGCDRLSAMGENGRRLVESRFQWAEIAGKLVQLYRWVLHEGPMPDYVHT